MWHIFKQTDEQKKKVNFHFVQYFHSDVERTLYRRKLYAVEPTSVRFFVRYFFLQATDPSLHVSGKKKNKESEMVLKLDTKARRRKYINE